MSEWTEPRPDYFKPAYIHPDWEVLVSCWDCDRTRPVDISAFPPDYPLKEFSRRMRCMACGGRGFLHPKPRRAWRVRAIQLPPE